jgi:hypothetical protein
MDTNELSRTVSVIYTYEIADNDTIVFEYENDEIVDGWPMSMFRQDYMYSTKSFIRIKKWVMDNHSELLL